MISPHEVTGVTVTGTDDMSGIHRGELAAIFRQTLQPFNSATTRWLVGGGFGVDLHFLQWISSHRTMGYVHVVVPFKVTDLVPDVQRAIDMAKRNHDDLDVTELDLAKEWPEKSYRDEYPEPYFAAAREMVNHSHVVVGFPHESKPASITNFTLSYGASLGLPRMIWPVGK
jgi:hypothetical protein